MQTVAIVPATAADVPLLAEYRFAMFADMIPASDFKVTKEAFLAEAEAYYRSKVGAADEVSLVARSGGEPIGCGTIMFQRRPPHVKNPANLFGYILNIYVSPAFRKQGVATFVMNALAAEASRRGVQRIGLHASEDGAIVYKRLGYANKPSYMEKEL